MSKTLEERLNSHSSSLSGLLSLLPANTYYDQEDGETQWKKKKQSKAEARAKKMAKLDPSNASNALEEMNNRDKKAQEKSKKVVNEKIKKDSDWEDVEEEGDQEEISLVFDDEGNERGKKLTVLNVPKSKPEKKVKKLPEAKASKENGKVQANGDVEQPEAEANDAPSTNAKDKKKKPSRSGEGVEKLRDALMKKIQDMKEKRKAPGTGDGAPLNREALLESRRQKQEAAKDRKKRKREEQDGDEDDEQSEQGEVFSDDEPAPAPLLFNAVKFKDGNTATSDLSAIRQERTKKKRDLLGQLKHIETRQAKIASLDQEKREQIEKNGQWSKAILQSEGEKVRDDVKLLKKSIKQQQKKKKKSEGEWKERKRNVAKGIASRQAKREENLEKRREMKGVKGKQARKRAGFEGKKPRKGKK